MDLIADLIKEQTQTNLPRFRVGYLLTINIEIFEKNKMRIQPFQGRCIRIRRPNSLSASFTLRKRTLGLGIEKTFKLNSPLIHSIKIHSGGHVRRAKLYYLRSRTGKAERLRYTSVN